MLKSSYMQAGTSFFKCILVRFFSFFQIISFYFKRQPRKLVCHNRLLCGYRDAFTRHAVFFRGNRCGNLFRLQQSRCLPVTASSMGPAISNCSLPGFPPGEIQRNALLFPCGQLLHSVVQTRLQFFPFHCFHFIHADTSSHPHFCIFKAAKISK